MQLMVGTVGLQQTGIETLYGLEEDEQDPRRTHRRDMGF